MRQPQEEELYCATISTQSRQSMAHTVIQAMLMTNHTPETKSFHKFHKMHSTSFLYRALKVN